MAIKKRKTQTETTKTISPPVETAPPKAKRKSKYNMWQNCCFMIRLAVQEKEKKVLVLSTLTALLAVALNLTEISITPAIIGAVETHAPFASLLAVIAGFVLLRMLLTAASSYVGTNILYGKVTLRGKLISLVNSKRNTTSYPNTYDEQFQKMESKANDSLNCNRAAGEAIWDTMTGLLRDFLGFLIYLALLSSIHPVLLIVITATALAGYILNKYLGGYSYRHREEEEECLNPIHCYNDYTANADIAKDIRLFGMRPWLEEMYAKAWTAYRLFHKRVQNVYLWGAVADLILSFLRNGFAYAYLIRMVLHDDLSIALFLLYFAAAGNFSGWIGGILSQLVTLHTQSLDLSTVREYLEYPEPFRFEEGEPLKPDFTQPYEIRLEDVCFRYPGAEEDTLSHVDLILHPGEKLAVVGPNGAGKTTLIKLLCGFLDPSSGRVLLNGKDIRQYNRRDYYKMFSAVFQDFNLLPATVAANVAQSEEHIELSRVKDCIAMAGLTEKIESLPRQYDSLLNRSVYEDATMLSGGETQRLMLARALYKDALFVVLDEPTAALDPIAEADLYGKYNEMTHGRSSVYISHRLASTRFCDRILLIQNGRIQEEGTHDELVSLGGSYAELYKVQSRYYREEDSVHEEE